MPSAISNVFVVEDDPDIQVILKMVLTRLGKCQVLHTDQGEQVLPMAQQHHPELILLDVMLPGMSGIEIIKALKNDGACRTIPVIFLTARTTPSEIHEMKSLGALGHLSKPFDPMTLVAQINELLFPLEMAIGG